MLRGRRSATFQRNIWLVFSFFVHSSLEEITKTKKKKNRNKLPTASLSSFIQRSVAKHKVISNVCDCLFISWPALFILLFYFKVRLHFGYCWIAEKKRARREKRRNGKNRARLVTAKPRRRRRRRRSSPVMENSAWPAFGRDSRCDARDECPADPLPYIY